MSAQGRTAGIQGVALASALGVAALAWVAAMGSDATPDGRLLAVPAARLAAVQEGPSVVIEECVPGSAGLGVRGRVAPLVGAARGEEVLLAVTGAGAGATPGRAVSLGFAATLGRGVEVGTFRLTLPWATVGSQFGVVLADAPAGEVARTGPVARCPR